MMLITRGTTLSMARRLAGAAFTITALGMAPAASALTGSCGMMAAWPHVFAEKGSDGYDESVVSVLDFSANRLYYNVSTLGIDTSKGGNSWHAAAASEVPFSASAGRAPGSVTISLAAPHAAAPLQFEVVPMKSGKGLQVQGVNNPIQGVCQML